MLGTLAMILSYLASEGELAEFSPMMLFGALGWLGLIVAPMLLVACVPLVFARSAMGLNAPTYLLLAAVIAASVIALSQPRRGDPYGAAIVGLFGATGLAWSLVILGSILWRRRRKTA